MTIFSEELIEGTRSYIGLSTDPKPDARSVWAPNAGDTFYEIDTRLTYIYFGGAWGCYEARRDLILSQKYWNIETKRQSGSNITPANAVGGANKDFRVCGTAESAWDAVRLVILNAETSNSVQGVTANFAPTANMAEILAAQIRPILYSNSN